MVNDYTQDFIDEVKGAVSGSGSSGGGTIDTQVRTDLANHTGNADIHVTADEKAEWNAKASTNYVDEKTASKADTSALTTHVNDTDIHVTTEKKAEWDAKANASDIPTSLPANGGNADTLDGMHANGFMQNLGALGSGSLLEHALSLTKSGYLYSGGEVTDTPIAGQHFGVEVRRTGNARSIVATHFSLGGTSTGGVYVNNYNAELGKWYGWTCLSDGGDAATVGGVSPTNIPQLMAPIISGDLLTQALSITKPGWFGVESTVTGIPSTSQSYYGEIRVTGPKRLLILTGTTDGQMYVNVYNGTTSWSGWKAINMTSV